jgi:methionyl-tRNA formyltransferase
LNNLKRIGFAGTPAFAATALKAILEAGMPVVAVLAQPDRPHGRGLKVEPGPVSALAAAQGIPLYQPAGLKSAQEQATLTGTALDVLVVVAYGLLLPPQILAWPKYGCLNIHASLLPRWRGAAPIQRALLAGDLETGISVMRMDAGLDTGPVVAQHRLPISARDTAGSLRDKLAALGASAIVEALRALGRNARLDATAQTEAAASYAAKIDARESVIDWEASAPSIDRTIRAFNPTPGARTTLDGELIKIWNAEPAPGGATSAGSVVRADAKGILIACGKNALLVRELQRAGSKRLSAAAFLAGRPLATNARFGAATG